MPLREEPAFETVLARAVKRSDSLRTTVPGLIVRQFGLRPGDKLRWRLAIRDGDMILEVEPVRIEDGRRGSDEQPKKRRSQERPRRSSK